MEHGDHKIKKWFAILPVCINGEWRWLKRVTVEYVYLDTHDYLFDDEFDMGGFWVKSRFIDE